MFELGIPLDPETERWILASRQIGVGVGAAGAPPPDGAQGAQGARDPAPQDAVHLFPECSRSTHHQATCAE